MEVENHIALQKMATIKKLSTNTYNIRYLDHDILTTVTNSPVVVASWITQIQSTYQPTVVGLDTESQKPISTLQLCVGTNCLIYQLKHSNIIPLALRNFLSDATWKFSGVGVKSDCTHLYKDYDLVVANIFDVSRAAFRKGMVTRMNAGLKEVAKATLGWEVEKCKEVTMSEWSREVLDDRQVVYACLDAFVSYQIAKELIALGVEDDDDELMVFVTKKNKKKKKKIELT